MEKPILVFYIGVKDLTEQGRHEILVNFKKLINKEYTFSNNIVLPNNENNETKVECVNPTILKEEDYEVTKEKIDKMLEKANEFFGNLK